MACVSCQGALGPVGRIRLAVWYEGADTVPLKCLWDASPGVAFGLHFTGLQSFVVGSGMHQVCLCCMLSKV